MNATQGRREYRYRVRWHNRLLDREESCSPDSYTNALALAQSQGLVPAMFENVRVERVDVTPRKEGAK